MELHVSRAEETLAEAVPVRTRITAAVAGVA
jgi:hypothetical protein